MLGGDAGGIDRRRPESLNDTERGKRVGAVDDDTSSVAQPGDGVGGIEQGWVENEQVVRFFDVLANEQVIPGFGATCKGHYGRAATIHAVVRIALNVSPCEKCCLCQCLRCDNRALFSAAMNPQSDHSAPPRSRDVPTSSPRIDEQKRGRMDLRAGTRKRP